MKDINPELITDKEFAMPIKVSIDEGHSACGGEDFIGGEDYIEGWGSG